VGVVFSGRQSPGGHNVVWGLHDALKAYNPQSVLYGFVGNKKTPNSFECSIQAELTTFKLHFLLLVQVTTFSFRALSESFVLLIGGTEGLFANKTLEITDDVLTSYKNQGWYTCCPLILCMFLLLSILTHGLFPSVKVVSICSAGVSIRSAQLSKSTLQWQHAAV